LDWKPLLSLEEKTTLPLIREKKRTRCQKRKKDQRISKESVAKLRALHPVPSNMTNFQNKGERGSDQSESTREVDKVETKSQGGSLGPKKGQKRQPGGPSTCFCESSESNVKKSGGGWRITME